jgi:hypothetical protein
MAAEFGVLSGLVRYGLQTPKHSVSSLWWAKLNDGWSFHVTGN